MPYVHAQSRAVADNMLEFTTIAREAADGVDELAAELETSFPVEDRSFTVDELAEVQAVLERVESDGFTSEEIAQLTSLGLDEAQIEVLRADMTYWDVSSATPGDNVDDALEFARRTASAPMLMRARNCSGVPRSQRVAQTRHQSRHSPLPLFKAPAHRSRSISRTPQRAPIWTRSSPVPGTSAMVYGGRRKHFPHLLGQRDVHRDPHRVRLPRVQSGDEADLRRDHCLRRTSRRSRAGTSCGRMSETAATSTCWRTTSI